MNRDEVEHGGDGDVLVTQVQNVLALDNSRDELLDDVGDDGRSELIFGEAVFP